MDRKIYKFRLSTEKENDNYVRRYIERNGRINSEEIAELLYKGISFVSKDTGVKTMEINSYEELDNFVQYAYARERSSFSDVAGTVGWISNDWGLAKLGDFDYYRVEYINGFKKADNTNQSNPVDELLGAVSEKVVPAYPVRVIVGKRLSLGAGLILVLQTIFPMVLTAGAIKEAPGYASKVMGL